MIEQEYLIRVQGVVGSPAGAVCNPNANAFDTFLVAIGGFPDEMLRSATALGSVLVGEGMLLLTYAFLATLAISLYRNLIVARGIEELMSDLVRAAVLGSITLALLNNWDGVSQAIPNWVRDSIINRLSPNNQPHNVIGQFIGIFGEMFREMTAWVGTGARPCGEAQSGIFAQLSSLWNSLTLTNIIDVIMMYMSLALAILIISIPLALFSGIMMAVLFGNALIIKIAIIFGPVMIAWIPFAPMAWLAMSWLRFMLITTVTLAIAYLIAGLLAGSILPVFRTLLGTAVNASGIGLPTIFMGVTIAIVLLFGAWMLSKADDIASGLIGGGGASNGGSFIHSMSRSVQRVSLGGKGTPGGGKPDGARPGSAPRTPGPASPAAANTSPSAANVSSRAGAANSG